MELEAPSGPVTGPLLAWAATSLPSSASGRGRATSRVGVRFAFYGRVSTEGFQDRSSSRRWQRDSAMELIRGRGRIVAEYFDVGCTRRQPWPRRPQARELLGAAAGPDRRRSRNSLTATVPATPSTRQAAATRPRRNRLRRLMLPARRGAGTGAPSASVAMRSQRAAGGGGRSRRPAVSRPIATTWRVELSSPRQEGQSTRCAISARLGVCSPSARRISRGLTPATAVPGSEPATRQDSRSLGPPPIPRG